ncbi:MAG: DEAD/DEAH box helicase family protein [Nocardioides sp.]
MKFQLTDYQQDAVGRMLDNFADARDDFHRKGRNVAFSLSATTGAGKTVMASAVIEGLFFGDPDHDFTADPGAVVLWFTDDPALNEQTRTRIMQASGDRIRFGQLQVIENTFNQEKFDPGNVYFLNAQKLSKNSLLVRGASADDDGEDGVLVSRAASPDLRQHTLWDTIKNTVEDPALTLYVVLDEAHKGMKQTSGHKQERQTIVKRLVDGGNGVPPVPVVWGISATIERFTEAMAGTQSRFNYPAYEVDAALIQESGLIKDDIRLDFPAETGDFSTVLLKRAVEKVRESTTKWADYKASPEGADADLVVPLLVVQVPNKPTDALLLDVVSTVRDVWPDLDARGIAHVFGEHADLDIGAHIVEYVSPERVQDTTRIRVLLAKDAISTGWDCPRAEVLMSFRPAKDRTHITQLLGRMVRTPLARRIAGQDTLNSVECVLPHFDRATAVQVGEVLLGKKKDGDDDTGGTGGGNGRRVLFNPVDMTPNPHVPDFVWAAFDALPCQTLPKKAAKPTRRLAALAQALSDDGLLPDARKTAYAALFAKLDGLAVEKKTELAAQIDSLMEVEGETVVATVGGDVATGDTFTTLADDRSVAADFRQAQRVFTPDLARKYADHIAVATGDDDGLFDAEITVAALALVPGVADELDTKAGQIADDWSTQHRVAIKALTDERRDAYNQIFGMSTDPVDVDIERPKVRTEDTETDDQGTKAPTRTRHLMSDTDGVNRPGESGGWVWWLSRLA